MKNLTLEDIIEFQRICLEEYDLPIGKMDVKHILMKYDTFEDQIEAARKKGSPAVALFHEGKPISYADYMKLRLNNK